MRLLYSLLLLLWCLFDHGFPWIVSDEVSVMEGDSVTLNTDFEVKQQQDIKWYFNYICIAQKSGDQSKICTDVQCEDGDMRFRGRLKLDHQTGSLTITNITNTHSGVYQLEIISIHEKIFIVTVHGADEDRVSVMEGDSVTLHTGVQTNQQDRITWSYYYIRIAQINQSNICTDVQCNEDTERFRDRLTLDNQTGSLTITPITDTHSGEYKLQISSGSSETEKIFNVMLYGVSVFERDKMKRKTVKEGESVILYTGVVRKLNDSITWYINEILIAEICDEPRKTCTDVQCNEGNERFRGRLKLDHQTGSLIITNTRNTDAGEYTLLIISSRFNITNSFSVSVTTTDSGVSSAVRGGISAAAIIGMSAFVILLVVAAAGIYYCHRTKQKINGIPRHDHHQENDVTVSLEPTANLQEGAANGTSSGQTNKPLIAADNEIPQ